MRIAIISDVHANAEAIQAFEERETYDELWVLGDLVNYGPNPREVIDYVRGHAALAVRGNHDYAIGCGEDPRCSTRYREMARAMGLYTASLLSCSEKAYLASLPQMQTRVADGKRFVLCHATPADPLFEYAGPNSAWIDRAEEAGADVLLVGHTHLPFVRSERGRTAANPGSIGQPKNGSPDASYAVWDGSRIELRSVPYPVERTIADLGRIGLAPEVFSDLSAVLRTGGRLKP